MFVFVACMAVALSFTGCGTEGDGGSGKNANSILNVESDPVMDAVAQGYISTVAAEFTGDPSRIMPPEMGDGLTAETRSVFTSSPTSYERGPGQVAAATVPPNRAGIRLDLRGGDVVATREGNGLVKLSSGDQVAFLQSVVRNNVTHTVVMGAGGMMTLAGEETFPRLVGENGKAAVAMSDGSAVLVQE